jgi:RNA polymerase sigma-70 factor (ECF subfamily)
MKARPQGAELPDDVLVAGILDGDEDLFPILVERYQTRLFRFVQRYTSDAEDARDVTQEVFFKVYCALDTFDPRYKFSTWLFRIGGNAAIDHLRRRKARPISLDLPRNNDGDVPEVEFVDEGPDPLEELSRSRLREELDLAISRLPDDYKELISLRHYGELPYEEIAEMKGMPLGTVKNKLFRARQALRDLLPKSGV